MNVLVVYYSRSGNTQRIARLVAQALHADLEPLVDARSRLGLRGWMRSGREAIARMLVAVEPLLHDVSRYDLVVVGTPVWAASPSSPVRTFLTGHRGKLPRVAFFCTCGGRGAERVFREMSRAAGQSPVDVLALRAPDLQGDLTAAITRFAREIRLALEPDRASPPAASPSAHTSA